MIIFGTDFDGTLYFHDREEHVQKVDVEGIKNFQKTGNLFGLVTGRGITMWDVIADRIEDKVHFDFRIHSNGACIVDRDGNVIFRKYLPDETLRMIFEKGKDVELVLHAERDLYVTNISEFQGMHNVKSLDEIEADEVYEVSFRYDTPKGAEFLEYLKTVPGLQISPNTDYVDVMAEGMTKGFGIKKMLELTHQDGITCAIGDSYNDQSMLEQTDISFTFPTSPQVVQDSANHIVNNIAEALDFVLKETQK